jgi:four helix bundle protein
MSDETHDEFHDDDPLSRMQVHQYATQLVEDSWDDAVKLRAYDVTAGVAKQLYTAVGSITANIAEGYSKSSGKDRARIFEIALGSARESAEWYKAARPVIGVDAASARLKLLGHIRRMLLAIIPRERDRLIRPKKKPQ